jgi:hypothetical protein
MNYVVREELWRTIGVFALLLVVFAGLTRDVLTPSIFTLLIFPLISTFFIFLFLVGVKTKFSQGRNFSLAFVGFLIVVSGILLFYLLGFSFTNLFLTILGFIIFIYVLVKIFNNI